MEKLLLIMMFFVLSHAGGPFDTPQDKVFDMSVFNTKPKKENTEASKNKKVICRVVCDKKIYKEQVIGDAISFYKSSKRYRFKGRSSK